MKLVGNDHCEPCRLCNFRLSHETDEWYDRYQGVTELMPYAKEVAAKSQ
ncbi:MAG: hypothetical protein R3C11_21620 [Planctomycetaceae bacterium]